MIGPDPVTGLVQHLPPASCPFGPSSIAEILAEGLERHPERLALVDGERTWTWADLDVAVAEVAAGIAPDEPVLWRLANCAELVIGSLATFRAGGIWLGSATPLDPSTVKRLETHLGPITTVMSTADMPSGDRPRPPIDVHAPAAVTFTSGTSGTPKAVVHSQHGLLIPGLISADTEPPTPGERLGTPLRLTILNLLVLGPMSALLRGSTFVVMNRTYAAGLAEDIVRFGVTRLFAVPTLIFDLTRAHDVAPDQLSGLDRLILGGSGADPRTLWEFFDRFDVRPTLSYGLSEAPTGVVRESLDDPIGSGRGFPLPHVRVVLDDGEICLEPSTEGRWARTWMPTLGYLGEPERTAALFAGGRLHTGDVGRFDKDGALSVTGRLSDLIIRGGKNIDPVAAERAWNDVQFVKEVLAVAVPDERLGEAVGVMVVVKDLDNADELDLVEILMRMEEESEVPIDHFVVVEALPRNAMGKVIRAVPQGTFGEHTRV